MSKLKNAIQAALNDCLRVKRDERCLIIGDTPKQDLAFQFYSEACARDLRAHFLLIPAVQHYSSALPAAASALMMEMDVIILVTSRSLSHTQARRNACKAGARIISMPGITEEVLVRTLPGSYKEILYKSRKLADILTIGRSVHLTSEAGSDLTFSITRMKGMADTGMVHEPGQFSNLPAGEGCVGPVQGSTNGILVLDGSFAQVGTLRSPVRMTVKNGQVIRIYGAAEADLIRRLLRPYGKDGRNIAELGIGTNIDAKLTGCTVEDEKVRGTVHIGLGNNISFGGKVDVECHFDGILLNPTLTIDNKMIIKNGDLLV